MLLARYCWRWSGNERFGEYDYRPGVGAAVGKQEDCMISARMRTFVNRHLFAFAAYNAGPNRIARLRKLAPEYGVDPNVWFKNVERIVASKVSREPVRYVRNIYKYYLAYRRLRELESERGGAQRR